jgi:hypothetical protein
MTAPTTTGYYSSDGASPANGARPDAPARHQVLTDAASRIRVRAGRLPVEQVLLFAASILFPLGLVFIMLGWYGAAHNGRTYAQISYLISGGIFGLALSVVGGFMYFGYWLSRQLAEGRRQNGLTVQSLHRIEELLEASLGQSLAPARDDGRADAARDDGRADAARDGRAPVLFATPRGTLLHRPECPVVAHRDDLKSIPAGTQGYGFCSMCDAEAVVR